MWPLAQPEPKHYTTSTLRGLLSVPHYATLCTIHYATLPQATTPVAVRYRWPMRERAPLHRALAFCDQAHRSSRHVFRPSKTIQGTCCWQSLSPNRPTGQLGGVGLNQGVPLKKPVQFEPWVAPFLGENTGNRESCFLRFLDRA